MQTCTIRKHGRLVVLIFGLRGIAASATISVEPDSQTVHLGDTLAVAVQIAGLGNGTTPKLGAFELVVTFDPAILLLQTTTSGDPVLGDQLDPTGGRNTISASRFPAPETSGSSS